LPKTIAEIAIEAGLMTKANAARAGKLAEERRQPLVVVMIRELGIDEVALVGALRKQTRVPLLDPAQIHIDTDALRLIARDVCARLRALPIGLTIEGTSRVLKVAMADPTDTTAIAELESLTHCEIDTAALPLSAIDELVDKGYKQISTAVVHRGTMFVTGKAKVVPLDGDEISVTAQIPLSALQASALQPDVESRLEALIGLLVAKGVITDAELADAVKKLR
jgi:hypothetical protein